MYLVYIERGINMRLFNKRKGWKKEAELLVIERENFLISLEKFNYEESYLLFHILMEYINQPSYDYIMNKAGY